MNKNLNLNPEFTADEINARAYELLTNLPNGTMVNSETFAILHDKALVSLAMEKQAEAIAAIAASVQEAAIHAARRRDEMAKEGDDEGAAKAHQELKLRYAELKGINEAYQQILAVAQGY